MICVMAERQRRNGNLPPRRGHAWQSLGATWLLSLFLVVALPAAAQAGKVEDLARMLLTDDSYKVRVQAAALLGKLGDPAAVAPLSRALSDGNKTVRWMAAQALARLGDPAAIPALKTLLTRESDGPVRTQAEKALALLAQSPRKTAKIFLTFGSFRGGVRGADPAVLEILRAALRRELAKLPTVTFEEVRPGNTGSSGGPVGFLIDGTVSRLDDGLSGSAEINCDVKVMVARWPSKSIILWTSAGAAVQGGGRPQDLANSRRDCLEASAGQLGEDLMKFFKSQGG
jgi:hypothetical protein